MDQIITNPLAAYKTVPSWILGRYDDGTPIDMYRVLCDDYVSAAAIVEGDLMELVAPTATQAPRVKQKVVADDALLVVGVAMNACSAAGQKVRVCTQGYVHINVGAGVPAFGSYLVAGAAVAGIADVVAPPAVAASLIGSIQAVALGVKDANNRVWAIFHPGPT